MTDSSKPTEVAYDGPPDYRVVGRHGIFPETSHDEVERINYLAQMNRPLSTRIMPGVKTSFEQNVEPEFRKKTGRDMANRHEARKAMLLVPVVGWGLTAQVTLAYITSAVDQSNASSATFSSTSIGAAPAGRP